MKNKKDFHRYKIIRVLIGIWSVSLGIIGGMDLAFFGVDWGALLIILISFLTMIDLIRDYEKYIKENVK
jgi:hypothetical protein